MGRGCSWIRSAVVNARVFSARSRPCRHGAVYEAGRRVSPVPSDNPSLGMPDGVGAEGGLGSGDGVGAAFEFGFGDVGDDEGVVLKDFGGDFA
jgi:hypothetical protein